MTQRFDGAIKTTAAALLTLAVTGCGSLTQTHQQNVKAAENRWLAARSDLMLNMAQRQFDTGDLDQAEKTLRDAVSAHPSNPRVHLLAGRVGLERGRLEYAASRFKTAIELDPKLADAHYYYGLVYQRWQQFDHALASYQAAADLVHDNPAYVMAVAEMLVAVDRWDDAKSLLEGKLVYFDQNAGIRVALGQLYLVKEAHARAVDYLRQAVLIRPDDPQIVELLVQARIGAQQFSEAAVDLQRLLEIESLQDRRDLRRSLGECYRAMGKLDDAKAEYLKLTRSDPTDVEAWIKLGEIAFDQDDMQGVQLAAHRVSALAPRRHEGPLLSGVVFQKRGNLERAIALFDKAAQLAPDITAPIILRGLALESAGRRDEAAGAYREALRRQPDDAQAQQLLTRVTGGGP